MTTDMATDPKRPPRRFEYDRRTPLSRLRYKDVEVRTWQIVVAVVVILAMLALMGFALLRLEAQHSGKRTSGASVNVMPSLPILLSPTR
jgi:hypothetical protein